MFLISILMSSAACTPAEDYDDEIGVASQQGKTAGELPAPPPPIIPTADEGQARSIEVSDEAITFQYSYPRQVGAIQALSAIMDDRAEAAQVEYRAYALEAKAEAEKNDYGFRQHDYSENWKVVADLPGWLSLSAEIGSYSGGAHGNYGFDALAWDKSAGQVLETKALFRSAAALDNALGGAFCSALNAERAERRGQPVAEGSDNSFDACPSVAELTVLLGSSNGETFDRIGLLAAPYVAGPYAEGSYEFTLPVTSAVIDAVKPEFASSFSIMANN